MTDEVLAQTLSDWKDSIVKLTEKITKGAGQLDRARQAFEDQKNSNFDRFIQLLPYLLVIIVPIVVIVCVAIFSNWVSWCRIEIPNYLTIIRNSSCK